MSRQPLISICLPNLNTRRFLEERMETILTQKFTDWELIVSDNFSDDGSWEYFQTFKGDPRIVLGQAPRRGMYANWNECLRLARGEYCYIATSDDTMSPECLEVLVAPLERFRRISIAVCDSEEIDENSRPIKGASRGHRAFFGAWQNAATVRNGMTEFLLHCAFGTTIWVTMTSVLFRRNLLDQIGYFNTDLGSKADEAWTLRASLASDVVYVPRKLATWRQHAGQATWNWDAREAERVMCRCIQSVIQDPNSGIPDAWKQIPGWENALSAHHRKKYTQTFKLFRWFARSNPKAFMRDVWDSMSLAPEWFWHQTLRGYPALENDIFDAAAHAMHLIKIFKAEWPPRMLDC